MGSRVSPYPPVCEKPDRDMPKMKCGYPLPCPHHTVFVDTTGSTVMVITPHSTGTNLETREKLAAIGGSLKRGLKKMRANARYGKKR